ncbi:MAG: transglycosylase SLT domain-containing protein [Pseudohongiella sp.]|uniref:transglycosylase SLT domain-containing protein n=1 Tax=Pseudohongiella sp. TaxID=1979412 RepID=UPI0034A037A2
MLTVTRRRNDVLKSLCLGLLTMVGAMPWLSTARAADNAQPQDLTEQRAIYQRARDAAAQNNKDELERLRAQLQDYPLLPYLDYALLSERLTVLARTDSDGERTDGQFFEIDQFLAQNSNSYLGDRLEREWVSALARENRGAELVRYHNPDNTTTQLTCRAMQANFELGDYTTLADADRLWNVAVSQPNDCDPVFEAWIEEGFLTPDIAWQRFSKTLQAGHRNLARYISSLMPDRERALAELYLRIDQEPERLRDLESLSARNAETGEIILHGIRRMMTIDAPLAMLLLQSHNDFHEFAPDVIIEHQRMIALRLLLQGFVRETETLLRNTPSLVTETLVSWILRDALRSQDWPRIEEWIARLPDDARESERWRYWQARMLEQKGTAESNAQAQALYRSVAATRSYYGFLSADLLDTEYELADTPVAVDPLQVTELYNIPSIVRARELYLTGDEINARNEWQYAVQRMEPQQIAASGKLADSWGWHRNSIQAMIRIGYWDDMQLRFPLAYSDQFARVAAELDIPTQLLFAIARQESAFMHDVRSPAGARGLMQLMPGTARETALGAGLRVNTADLYLPEINITLGSRYLAGLLEEFDGNRALAAAAYNAGPNRVKQWLRRGVDNPVPLDIWIETIPFLETRGYVQNVLAYSVIYGYRMGEPVPFLTPAEAAAVL